MDRDLVPGVGVGVAGAGGEHLRAQAARGAVGVVGRRRERGEPEWRGIGCGVALLVVDEAVVEAAREQGRLRVAGSAMPVRGGEGY